MDKQVQVLALIEQTVKPAALLVATTQKREAQAAARRKLIIDTVAQAQPDAPVMTVAFDSVVALYRASGVPLNFPEIHAELEEAKRHGRSFADHAAFILPDKTAIDAFAQRGWGAYTLTLDTAALVALLTGATLGDFTDEEYTHLVTLSPEAKQWVQAHVQL